MKKRKNIFIRIFKDEIKLRPLLLVLSLSVYAPVALAASDNGCVNEDNDRITPELALCSTHVFNIGATTNPSNETDKQLMRDVVALKTTVMTQQMKKQYDYLEATIRRFKTQLEKAILTTKLQAAGAADDSTSGGGATSTGDRNIYLAGTNNCNNQATPAEVFACLRNNYNLIYNMSSGGNNLTIELRKQLANDCYVLNQNVPVTGIADTGLTNVSINAGASKIDCTKYNNIRSRTEFQACMDALNVQIRNATTAYNTKLLQGNRQGQQSSF